MMAGAGAVTLGSDMEAIRDGVRVLKSTCSDSEREGKLCEREVNF